MRAGKPLPVLYTPSQGERGKCWPLKPKLDQDRTHGHSRVRLRPFLCLEFHKGGKRCETGEFHQLSLRIASPAIFAGAGPIERNGVRKSL